MKLITKEISLKDINFPEWANEALKKYGVEKESAFLVRKGLVSDDVKFAEGERASIDYITTKSIDRDGEIVLPQGAILDDYRKQPIVLWAHNYSAMPLGKNLWIKADEKGLIAKTQYASKEANPFADQVWNFRKEGFPIAKSIGFVPLSWIDQDEYDGVDFKAMGLDKKVAMKSKRIYDKYLLLEYSDCPVQSNPDAIEIAIAKGILNKDHSNKNIADISLEILKEIELEKIEISKELDLENIEIKDETVTKPETTANYHRIPVIPKEQFVQTSFRTIDITTGIKAIIGKLKSDPSGSTKVHTYLFDVNKFSMSEAEAWVEAHKKDVLEENIEEKELEEAEEKAKKPCKKEMCDGEECQEFDSCTESMKKVKEASEDEDPMPCEDGGECPGTNCPQHKACAKPEKKSSKWLENISVKIDVDLDIDLDKIISEEIEIFKSSIIEEKQPVIDNDQDRIIKLFNSCNIKNINKEEISQQVKDEFDITKVKVEPYGFEYKIFCKYLGCKIKDIFPTSFFIPSAMQGNYLSAFKNVFSSHTLLEQRNFTQSGNEVPLRFSVVALKSNISEEFLTEGTQFFKSKEGPRFISQIYPSWGGTVIDLYTDKSGIEFNKSLVKDAVTWVEENNLLKGEKFSISGEFLEKTGVDWEDIIFPTTKDENTIKSNIERLSKTSGSRGIMFIGPPGTGKTRTGRVLMEKADTTFIWASSKDFKYGATSALSVGFEMARKLAPSVFFLEDIDSWLNGYAVDLLKTEMDGIRDNKGVLTVLTSNFPEQVPDALIDRPGRFHHIVNFSLPNIDNRMKMLNKWIPEVNEDELKSFAEMTEGFSGAHMKELVDFAKIISEDENITLGEALIESLKQMKEQRNLINNIKNDKKTKDIDLKIETKSIEEKEINLEAIEQKEVKSALDESLEIDITPEQLGDLIKDAILNVTKETKKNNEIDLSQITMDALKKAKGEIF